MVIVTAAFKPWLKASTNMKLSSDAFVNRVIHEGITDFNSLIDFDKDTIQYLPKVCKESTAAIAAIVVRGVCNNSSNGSLTHLGQILNGIFVEVN